VSDLPVQGLHVPPYWLSLCGDELCVQQSSMSQAHWGSTSTSPKLTIGPLQSSKAEIAGLGAEPLLTGAMVPKSLS
jgi:hypothetical protein